MDTRMRPRVKREGREPWAWYERTWRSYSASFGVFFDEGYEEELLGLLEYALGYPLARVRDWLARAARRHLKRLQLRDAGGAREVISLHSLRYACLACVVGDFGLARDIALRIEDPPDANYIGTRSEACTPRQQHVAYAFRALFAEDRPAAEAHLRQVRRRRHDDEESLQAACATA